VSFVPNISFLLEVPLSKLQESEFSPFPSLEFRNPPSPLHSISSKHYSCKDHGLVSVLTHMLNILDMFSMGVTVHHRQCCRRSVVGHRDSRRESMWSTFVNGGSHRSTPMHHHLVLV